MMMLAVLPALIFAQWSNNPNQNTAVAAAQGEQALPKVAMHESGITYISWFSIEGGNYNVRLQKFNITGHKQWTDEGLLISNHPAMTWLTDWDLTVDQDACAIITFQDIRNGNNNIYAYRISPDGDFLWGANGLALSNNSDFEAAPVVTISSQNNAVIAWTRGNTIMIQKVSPSGQKLWGENGIQLQGSETYAWPFIVPAANDEIIMSFFKQTGPAWAPTKNVFAQRFSASGELLWGTGLAISSNAAIPVYVKSKIISDGNNGAFIVWHRDNGSYFDAYVQRVLPNGTLAYPMNGVAVSLSTGTHQIDPVMAYDASDQVLYLAWREQSFNQNTRGISAQKLSLSGSRLWGDNGKVVVPMQGGEKASLNIAMTGVNPVITFFDTPAGASYYLVKAIRLNMQGQPYWPGGEVGVSLVQSSKMHNHATAFRHGQLVITWNDQRSDSGDIYAQNLKSDGTLGPITLVLSGDANCDGIVNVLDVITITNYVLGINPTPFCYENADANGDGFISVLDIIATVTFIMGK